MALTHLLSALHILPLALSLAFSATLATNTQPAIALTFDADGDVIDSDAYPHITDLENLILGQNYQKLQLPERLSQLEVKTFGKASTNPDLSARTDALDNYVQKTLHKNPFHLNAAVDDRDDDQITVQPYNGQTSNNSQSGTQTQPSVTQWTTANNGYAQDDTADQPDYPHIDKLERDILGETYKRDVLESRLSRMEIKAFGKASPNPDLSQRTDDLQSYDSNVLHNKSFEQMQRAEANNYDGTDADDDSQNQGPSKNKKIASFVGNTLLSMAGLGFGNYAGTRIRQRTADDVNDSDAPGPRQQQQQEDPLVNSPSPPPAGTRMITQVGWAEKQVFGQTYPNMHLLDRLTQLNQKLNFAPGQAGVDLMDDMGSLMNTIAMKKSAQTM